MILQSVFFLTVGWHDFLLKKRFDAFSSNMKTGFTLKKRKVLNEKAHFCLLTIYYYRYFINYRYFIKSRLFFVNKNRLSYKITLYVKIIFKISFYEKMTF